MIASARDSLRLLASALPAALLTVALASGALAQPTPIPAPSTPAEEEEIRKPTSSWSGTIELPGEPLAVTVHFDYPAPGTATMDIPAQDMSGEPLSMLERGEGFIRFQWRSMGREGGSAVFDLVVDETGAAASGTMKQFGQTFKVSIKRVFEAPATDPEAANAPRAQTPQAPFLYTSRPVSFSSAADGVRISGTLTIPGFPPAGRVFDDERHPVVIIVGGAEARDRDGTIERHKPYWVLADYLAMHGIAALRVDDRGIGASTGEKAKASLEDLIADMRAAAGILRVQPDIDSTRMALIGFGEGATVVARAGAAMPEVKAIVLITTRMTPADAMPNAAANKEATAPSAMTKEALILRGGGEHRSAYWDQHDNDSDIALMKQEGADPVEVRVLENLNMWMQTLPLGADPTRIGALDETFAPAAMEVITGWLHQRLGK